jgi:hypothetical protein
VESAFRAFANANRDYWVPNETMAGGACKVEQAATDNGYDATDVAAAFAVVGLACGGGGAQTYTNNNDYSIPDRGMANSPIAVSGRSGNAPSSTPVHVEILHSNRGQLTVTLVAPDNSKYRLKARRLRDTADNVIATYSVNLSNEPLNGTWKLRVVDSVTGETGYIDTWSITF